MIEIMLVSKQEQTLNTLRQFIGTDPELTVIAEAPGGDAVLEKVENEAPEILILNSGGLDTDAVSLAERIIMRKPRTFVIILVQEVTVEVLQSANAAGCHNVMPFPAEAKELCGCIHRVFNTESGRIVALDSNERVTWASKVLTAFGAKGGLGKTTIAVNLAIKLAEGNKKVALVDLDLQFGDVHIFMDADPKETIADLVQDLVNPTIDSVRSYMSVHSSGVSLLCAPKSPEYADMISGERIQRLLALLRANFDYVIVDTGTNFSDATLAALEASTTILFVTGLDVSILKNSKAAMNILDSLGLKKKVRVIINRAVEINSITIDDVQKIVDAPILMQIPSDYMTAVAALNQGQPFVQTMPKAKLSMAISEVASRIIGGEDNYDLLQLSVRERRAQLRKYRTKDKAEKRGRRKKKR